MTHRHMSRNHHLVKWDFLAVFRSLINLTVIPLREFSAYHLRRALCTRACQFSACGNLLRLTVTREFVVPEVHLLHSAKDADELIDLGDVQTFSVYGMVG